MHKEAELKRSPILRFLPHPKVAINRTLSIFDLELDLDSLRERFEGARPIADRLHLALLAQ